jgi:ABC-type Mn2+/Zn2+ transport system ATPase subunit
MTRLEVVDISRRYGDLVALSEVSLRVEPGEILGLVGPNGAGKTTAMRIVLGLLEPQGGEVRWAGRPVDAATRRRFGYMRRNAACTRRCGSATSSPTSRSSAAPTRARWASRSRAALAARGDRQGR